MYSYELLLDMETNLMTSARTYKIDVDYSRNLANVAYNHNVYLFETEEDAAFNLRNAIETYMDKQREMIRDCETRMQAAHRCLFETV